jgi:hypothetical protein
MSNDLERFMNLTLSLVDPELFKSGLEALQRLRCMEETKDVALRWQSVYSGISIVCNRITPPHRDNKGRPEWFDTLINYSQSGASPRLEIDDIGLDLDYSSGAVVSFCGRVLKHEVKAWGMGDRICFAHFMRDAVLERLLDRKPAGWVYRNQYLFPERQTSMDIIVEEHALDAD